MLQFGQPGTALEIRNNKVKVVIVIHAVGSRGGVGFLPLFVCVSVFPYDISETYAARITKLDIEMFHDEPWKHIYFGVKRSRSRVIKTYAGVGLCTLVSAGFFWLLLLLLLLY